MPDFKKNFRSSTARPFKRGGNFNSRERSFDQKELYDAECSNCHKTCKVPFRPNGTKPVYCKDCFTPDTDRAQKPRFEHRSPAQGYAPSAPRETKDPRIDDVLHRLDSIERTLEKLSELLEGSVRKEALTAEVRKHIPVEKSAAKPKKATKKIAKVK
jgi:CxxC-x17-CxxC domain-containing protein